MTRSRSPVQTRRARIDYDGRDAADPYDRAVRVAKQAHRSYERLVKLYDAHGHNARVARITQRQLNRAANAVADLGAGL